MCPNHSVVGMFVGAWFQPHRWQLQRSSSSMCQSQKQQKVIFLKSDYVQSYGKVYFLRKTNLREGAETANIFAHIVALNTLCPQPEPDEVQVFDYDQGAK